jgi:5'-3' exoribonuclease 1
LTAEEKKRNTFGTSIKFSYNPAEPFYFPSSLPGFLPNLPNCTCRMDDFDLPTLNGLPLIDGLREGVALGAEALAGFPSLKTLPHSAHLDFHGINVHGSESRNKSMVVHINNPYELMKAEDVAEKLIGKPTFIGWPFLREGLVTAVSNEHSKYEKIAQHNTSVETVISTPHTHASIGLWRTKAQKTQDTYSKRCGVITGPVDILLHVRPLKGSCFSLMHVCSRLSFYILGMNRLESGALVKEYEGADHEAEHAVQMTLREVVSEDPRYLEKDAPVLSEEYPEGSKVFFVGEHAYGVAAQVSGTMETSLSVVLAVRLLLSNNFSLTSLLSSFLRLTRPRTRSLKPWQLTIPRIAIIHLSRRPKCLACLGELFPGSHPA